MIFITGLIALLCWQGSRTVMVLLSTSLHAWLRRQKYMQRYAEDIQISLPIQISGLDALST